MSDNENEQDEEKPFVAELAKQGRAACKKCKQKCASGELRIAKLAYNPYGSDKMKQWYHPACIFELFMTQRPATKRIEDEDDVEGFDNLNEDAKNEILEKIKESEKKLKEKWGDKLVKKPPKMLNTPKKILNVSATSASDVKLVTTPSKDILFREFRRLVADVTNENSYLEKTAIIKKYLTKGSDGSGFKGDIIQWCRLLLPGVVKRIYNLQSKQLVKLFSKIFETDQEEMLEDLEQGDIGETIQEFFEKSNTITPSKKCIITMQEVDDFLEELSTLSKEVEQMQLFKKIVKKCTSNDLKTIIRLIKHDLRMNAGAKHVLDAIHPDAYEAFQSSRDLTSVLNKILTGTAIPNTIKTVKAMISVMTPVLPMLAEACKSVEQAMKKCPNGMYSEIKYDGERVQLHKHGNEFKYFSRSLKPVMPHKVNHFKDYIPQAFPHAKDLILDCEVLMIDNVTGKPLPFGSLGVHKRGEFKNANVCLFVFDCIYYNGEILTHKPMKERRRILKENMTEIKNHIMFSEVEEVHRATDLAKMIAKVLKLGLEGLVLKDLNSVYEPGKRHWLKVKKDYLCDGAMADSADLIVLGAWFGTGKKGGMMSVFLMGCYDPFSKKFLTVTKVHTGHDDKTLERLQSELQMEKISCDYSKVPTWLKCTKTMVPDFVAKDPKKQPVWEITGAEFTQHEVHTADGISIRFPRVTKIRADKTWEEATNLQELKTLYKNSKENLDLSMLTKHIKTEEDTDEPENCLAPYLKQEKIKIENEIGENSLDEQMEKKEDKIKYEMNDEMEIKKEKLEEPEKMDICFTPVSKRKRTKGQKIKNEYTDFSSNSPVKKLCMRTDLFPVIFNNVKIFFLDSISDEVDDIIRHFIAVGGAVLKNNDRQKATHVIHSQGEISKLPEDIPLTAKHVVFDWIRDSIGRLKIQDTRPYSVVWIPS